ncbi:MAG: flavin reductase family protein [Pseudomonadota bacterium]|nr:flavin reductase family protein [Pseudomonadota bacterium]
MKNSRDFRDALGRYPTGVAIVGAYADGVALGMTINSFASVSLAPPLVLWSIEKNSERCSIFDGAAFYSISILAHDQSGLAHACALDADFNACNIEWDGDKAPLVRGAVATFLCKPYAVYAGGDHDILVGEVVEMTTPRDVPALEFYRGNYGVAG